MKDKKAHAIQKGHLHEEKGLRQQGLQQQGGEVAKRGVKNVHGSIDAASNCIIMNGNVCFIQVFCLMDDHPIWGKDMCKLSVTGTTIPSSIIGVKGVRILSYREGGEDNVRVSIDEASGTITITPTSDKIVAAMGRRRLADHGGVTIEGEATTESGQKERHQIHISILARKKGTSSGKGGHSKMEFFPRLLR
eukprot:1161676-Pelagomonas_calceolata.AAC.5